MKFSSVKYAIVGLSLTFVFLTANPASAQLVATGTDLYGAGSATLDTETGLEWLDITYTSAITGAYWSDVKSWIAGGGKLEGWRVAEFEEVASLFSHAGISEATSASHGLASISDQEAASDLIDLVGYTKIVEVETDDGITEYYQIRAGTEFCYVESEFREFDGISISYDWRTEFGYMYRWDINDWEEMCNDFDPAGYNIFEAWGMGAFLVRDTAVPVPSAVFLMAAGILGLAGVKRRSGE